MRIKQMVPKVRTLWSTKRWFRYAVVAFAAMTVYQGGVAEGERNMDPRREGGPGGTVTREQLAGHWDGILTTRDGRAFCMVGWPCEDAGLDK